MCANVLLEWSRNYVSEFSDEALDMEGNMVGIGLVIHNSKGNLDRETGIDAAVVVNWINEVDSRRRPPPQAAVLLFRSLPPSPSQPDMDVDVNHCKVLGLPSGVEGAKLTEKEISKAYKLRALKLHPDKVT
ncbi:hypothetical protein Q3G72_010748 [Acer saccharum]|nr:hypothetical protein Q3G72_010748 [Acer saccharum]